MAGAEWAAAKRLGSSFGSKSLAALQAIMRKYLTDLDPVLRRVGYPSLCQLSRADVLNRYPAAALDATEPADLLDSIEKENAEVTV